MTQAILKKLTKKALKADLMRAVDTDADAVAIGSTLVERIVTADKADGEAVLAANLARGSSAVAYFELLAQPSNVFRMLGMDEEKDKSAKVRCEFIRGVLKSKGHDVSVDTIEDRVGLGCVLVAAVIEGKAANIAEAVKICSTPAAARILRRGLKSRHNVDTATGALVERKGAKARPWSLARHIMVEDPDVTGPIGERFAEMKKARKTMSEHEAANKANPKDTPKPRPKHEANAERIDKLVEAVAAEISGTKEARSLARRFSKSVNESLQIHLAALLA